jgi:hypothetical protein
VPTIHVLCCHHCILLGRPPCNPNKAVLASHSTQIKPLSLWRLALARTPGTWAGLIVLRWLADESPSLLVKPINNGGWQG